MGEALLWLLTNLALGVWNLVYAATHPASWLNWSDDPESLIRFIYYGASVELFFVIFDLFLIVLVIGLVYRGFLWQVVRVLEGIGNWVGRAFAWAGLLMVLQQILIVFLQSVFRVSEITIAPLGMGITFPIAWYTESLKFYNALVVALCLSYTFIQKGHVRVDLVYAAVSFRARKILDMVGTLIFMMPMAVLIWLYGWFFLWRSLVTPPMSAGNDLDALLLRARVVRWNVETTGFSPSGFNAYFLFKVLLVALAGFIFLQAVTFFYRSLLEYLEGEESEDKYLDRDKLGDPSEEKQHEIHSGAA
jgi:TRAP-type mannitol/chloroaromatic compound transport system permease small subunit